MVLRGTVENDRGMALLVALFMVLAVSLLGMTALHLAAQEIDSVTALRHEAASLHLAEAGADVVMGWAHDPSSVPSNELRQLFANRMGETGTGAGSMEIPRRTPFHGTVDRPDVWFDARRPEHDELMNDPSRGWFHALNGVGRVTEMKLFAPANPESLCTVEVTAIGQNGRQDSTQKVRVQLAAFPMPPLRAAVQLGTLPAVGGTASSLLTHWGDLQVAGDAALRAWADVPERSDLAPLTGQSYLDMGQREDRWHEMRVGGTVMLTQPSAVDRMVPFNVLQGQLPVPGLKLDLWDYARLKRLAQNHGTYYVVDTQGRLHRDTIQSGLMGLTLDEVMQSETVGRHRGLVFVDTVDQQPPGADNLAHLSVEAPYAEGVFVINAHLNWKPRGAGMSFTVLTPSTAAATSVATRVPVQLSGMHLNGALYVTGALRMDGAARVFGAVVVETSLITTGAGLEVWYNDDLRLGLYRGLPVVTVVPGSRRAA